MNFMQGTDTSFIAQTVGILLLLKISGLVACCSSEISIKSLTFAVATIKISFSPTPLLWYLSETIPSNHFIFKAF